jgi:hypothetical protein
VRLQAEQMQLEDQRAILGDMETQIDLKMVEIGASTCGSSRTCGK